jgi:hypothetical protein
MKTLMLLFACLLLLAVTVTSAAAQDCQNGTMMCPSGEMVMCIFGCPTLNCPADCGCPGNKQPNCAFKKLLAGGMPPAVSLVSPRMRVQALIVPPVAVAFLDRRGLTVPRWR